MSREMLKSMLHNFINDKTDEASADLAAHTASVLRAKAGFAPVEPVTQTVDETTDESDEA